MSDKYLDIKIYKQFLEKDELEIEYKLAHLLLEHEIFCNDGWWYKNENKPWQEGYITHHVNCNDVFAWGCADSEDVIYSEISDLYEHFKKDPKWGTSIWCIKKRKLKPQVPVIDIIKKEGIWDIDQICKDFK